MRGRVKTRRTEESDQSNMGTSAPSINAAFLDTLKENCTLCFSCIPPELMEEVCLDNILTLNSALPRNHHAAAGVAVMYQETEWGSGNYMFKGMIFITFINQEMAVFF